MRINGLGGNRVLNMVYSERRMIYMEIVRKLGMVVLTTAVSALTYCVVTDKYNTYVHDEVAMGELKNKISKLNPFKKD